MSLFFRGSKTSTPEVTTTIATASAPNSTITWNPTITSAETLAEQVDEYVTLSRANAQDLQEAISNYEEYLVRELNRIQELQEQLNPTTNGGGVQPAVTTTPKRRRRRGGRARTRPTGWSNGLSHKSYEATKMALATLGEATNTELIKISGVHNTSVRAATKWMRDRDEVEVVSGNGTARQPYVYRLTDKGRKSLEQ